MAGLHQGRVRHARVRVRGTVRLQHRAAAGLRSRGGGDAGFEPAGNFRYIFHRALCIFYLSWRRNLIGRVSGIDSLSPLGRFDSRLARLKQQLNRNDRIEFRYRSRRLTGTVVDLRQRALIVTFELEGREITRPVSYGSILKVLDR